MGEPFGGREELLEVMPGSDEVGYVGWSAVRTPDARFIRWDDGKRELYDLVADPWELREPRQGGARAGRPQMEARLDDLLASATVAEG